jgi:diguanylate cyclase (GGDEF)-like protein
MTQAERGSFMMVEEGTDKLVIKVARGINSDVIEGLRIKMGNSIVDQVIRSGKHLLVTNVEGDPVIGRTNINSRYRTSSFLSVPMLKEGKVVGVLNLADKMGGESFDPDDLRVVTTLISQASISLERVELYNDLEKLSVTDGLTGLYNHRYFQERLGEEIIRGGQYHYPVSLIIFDIDHFKRYNDTYGHPMGDEALKKIADILRSTTRKTDIPARYGGEEIAVILPKTDKEKAITVAERMRKAVSKCDFVQDDGTPTRKITLSAGVASYPQDADIKKELVGLADKALYAAKDKGRNRVCY